MEASVSDLVSRRSAALLAGVSLSTMIAAIRRGELRAQFIAGRWLLDPRDVKRWAAARCERRGRPRRIPTLITTGATDG